MNDSSAYQEGIYEELLDGCPVAMSPRPAVNHNRIAGNIYAIFHRFLRGKPCEPFADGVDLYLTEQDRFIPDMMVVCEAEKVREDGVYGAPSLVVEVLSPSSVKRDKGYKKDTYEAAGVTEYWLVDPGNKSVEVYLLRDGTYRLEEVYTVYPAYLLAKMTSEERAALPTRIRCSLYDELEISLKDIFARVP